MEELKKLLILFSQFDITPSKCKQILNVMGEKSIKAFTKIKFDESVLSANNYNKMLYQADKDKIFAFEQNLANDGIKIVANFENVFPQKLIDLPDCPYILYYKGDISLANTSSLAVVGSRKPTNYGRVVTNKLVGDVSLAGVTVISGMAYGVDSIAHKRCLEVGGKTIAVLGSGLNNIYPKEHRALFEEIAEKGLVISEYSPEKAATKYSFPARNRIIAGLSDGVLITEASIKSGTIHTKEFALEYGKNIYAVPGNIDSEASQLTNEVIKTGQGCCVTSSKDILNDYVAEKYEQSVQTNMFDGLSDEEKIIVDCLSKGMKSIEQLTQETKLSINILNTYLTTLEISGIIRRLPGGNLSLN